jgi:hypothetical protein
MQSGGYFDFANQLDTSLSAASSNSSSSTAVDAPSLPLYEPGDKSPNVRYSLYSKVHITCS